MSRIANTRGAQLDLSPRLEVDPTASFSSQRSTSAGRLLEYTGNIPPAEFEDMHYREQSLIEDEGLKQLSLQ